MRHNQSSVKLNMLMNFLLTASSIIFPLIILPYVTRVLGTDGTGRVFFASSIVSGCAMLSEFGIPVYGIRACARVRDDRVALSKTVQEIMGVNLVTCMITYALLIAMMYAVPRLAEDRVLIIIMSSTLLMNCVGAEWLYKALEKYTYITIRSIAFKIVALILMFAMVKAPEDYIVYGFLAIFAVLASSFSNLCLMHRHIDMRVTGGYDFARHVPEMLVFMMIAAATTIYTNLDLAILGIMKGNQEAAIYGIAVRIKLVVVNLVISVGAVLLPRVSYYYHGGRTNEATTLLSSTMKMVIYFSAGAVVFFLITADDCIAILAGESFRDALLPMRIIMPSVVIIGVSNLIGMQILIPEGREKAVAISAMLGAVSDLILNFILIPRYASTGAALATLLAEIVVAGYMLRSIGAERCRDIFRQTNLVGLAVPLCVAAGLTIYIRRFWVEPISRICVSSAIFMIICAATLAAIKNHHKSGTRT